LMPVTMASRWAWLFRENSLRTCRPNIIIITIIIIRYTEQDGMKTWSQYLAGVLDHAHPGGVEADVQRAEDVDHELPHGLELVRPDAARAVDEEDQVHRAGLALLLRTWREGEPERKTSSV